MGRTLTTTWLTSSAIAGSQGLTTSDSKDTYSIVLSFIHILTDQKSEINYYFDRQVCIKNIAKIT